jgi:hypothetical protein
MITSHNKIIYTLVKHRLMVMHPQTKYYWPISKDKNVMARTRKYYLKNNYLTLRSKVKVPWRSLRYATQTSRSNNCFLNSIIQLIMVCGCMTIRRCVAYRNDLCGTLTSRSNNCFLNSIMRSKVKVPWRSLRYATHHLMVMHPHTNYNWPIWKDKKSYGPDKFPGKNVF